MCGVDPNYCPQYSMHGWDTISFLNTWSSAGYNVSGSDLEYIAVLRYYFLTFLNKGVMPEPWQPLYNHFNMSYNVNILNINSSYSIDFKQEECSYWFQNGFFNYSWRGN